MKSAAIISTSIIALALVATMGLYLYFSPYHSCVRALTASDYERADAALSCLHGIEAEPRDPGVRGNLTRTRLLR